jgi:hypothetical protein
MPQLFDTIKRLVTANRYIVSEHAVERLDERRVLEWQVVDGIRNARLLNERPRDKPSPSVEVLQLLADGTEVKVIWSHVRAIDAAKLVTVHFLDA